MQLLNKTPYGALIEQIVARVPENYHANLHRICIEMSDTLRTTGGFAKWHRETNISTITLNAALFATLTEPQKWEILSHEIAHAVLQVHGVFCKHKWQWQKLHRKLGGTASRCHSHDVKHNDRRRVVVYQPGSGKYGLYSLQKYTKIRTGDITFKSPIVVVGIIRIDMDARTYEWEKLLIAIHKHAELLHKDFKLAA